MDHLHWRCYFVKMLPTATEYVLALATLGGNRNNPICFAPPKVAKARTMVSVACRCRLHYRDKLRQCKHGLRNATVACVFANITLPE
jgi:hypothetical protein